MRPLQPPDFPCAAQLLHEGFPVHPPAFWTAALQRLLHHGGNAEAGVPLGWFMLNGDEPVGVVLTPASLRHPPGGRTERIVNLSSWYVRPEFRWRAGFMLRGVLTDRDTIYTDLTPNEDVQKILSKLGFAPVNCGVLLHLLPLLCLHPAGGARVHTLQPCEPWPAAGPLRAMVEDHRALGCVPLVLESAQGRQLFVCKPGRVRGLPAMQLVYAESQSRLLQHRGALARHLLRHGVMLFVHDTRQTASTPTAWFRRRDLWFARGHDFADRTDALASELCIIHPARDAAAVTQPAAAAPGQRC